LSIQDRTAVEWALIRQPLDLVKLITPYWRVKPESWIIKPNWLDDNPGIFTTAPVLDLVLSALPGHKLVVESHTSRGPSREDNIPFKDMSSLERAKRHRDKFKRRFDRFLQTHGLIEVLKNHEVEILNITEAIWDNDVVDPEYIQNILLERGYKLNYPEIAHSFPQRLFELQGTPFVNLGRFKVISSRLRERVGLSQAIPSLSFKNLFGLEPTPLRLKYHFDNNPQPLLHAIQDLNRLYSAFFPVLNIIDAIDNAVVFDIEGEYNVPYGDYWLIEKPEIAIVSPHITSLDRYCYYLANMDHNDQFYSATEEVHGSAYELSWPNTHPVEFINQIKKIQS
jgi:hypothetical protein